MDKNDILELGKNYHEGTSVSYGDSAWAETTRGDPFATVLEVSEEMRPTSHVKRIALPNPKQYEDPLSSVIAKRISSRDFVPRTLTLQRLSNVMATAAGVTRRIGKERGLAYPSAGNLQSVELFVFALRVEGLACGNYRYDAESHSLDVVVTGDYRTWAEKIMVPKDWAKNANAVFLLGVNFARLQAKYQERAYRLGYLDAGHVSQNLLLAATAEKLGACPHAAVPNLTIDPVLGIEAHSCSTTLAVVIGERCT